MHHRVGMADKLLWVLLPIVLAGAVVAVLALRGRLPSRPVLNVWFSLLLLLYLLSTAGLGIFWVANQHLPVFDWHYVFGYSMLVLLALHLAFNLRTVWHHLSRRRAAPAVLPQRRPLLGGGLAVLGAAAVGGVSFWLGLRYGRTELRVAGDAAAATSTATAWSVVEQFHAQSSHSRSGLLRRAASADWGEPPPPFKTYPDRPRIGLPPPRQVGARTSALDLAALGAMLWHTAGVSLERGGIAFRTSPSSGALFATELYVAVRSVQGCAPGLWHYDARAHALEALRESAPDDAVWPQGAAAVVCASALFRRSGHKYGDRTYRYVLADLGHALENLRVAAAALGTTLALQPAFDESRIAAALGLDEVQEGVLALAALYPAAAASDAAPATTAWQPAPIDAGGPVPQPLGLTTAVHRATSLRASSGPVTSMPPIPPSNAAPSAPARVHPLPPPQRAAGDRLALIARRRSQRRFAATPLSQADLSAVLAAMAAQAPLLSRALRIDVVTQAVQGLEAAAWRYDARQHVLHLRVRHEGAPLHRRSRAAALDQDVVGDAAAVFVLSIARAEIASEPLGAARGWRHAFIEAGLVGERLYLEGAARGLGVCAVGAFYDEEAAALVGVDPAHEWVVHFAALGVPA